MTKAEFIDGVCRGRVLVLAEYRLFKAEEPGWRDKKTGESRKAVVYTHSVEFGDTFVKVSEFAPEGVTLASARSAFSKGQRVVVEVRSLNTLQGNVTCRGKIHPYVDESPKVR